MCHSDVWQLKTRLRLSRDSFSVIPLIVELRSIFVRCLETPSSQRASTSWQSQVRYFGKRALRRKWVTCTWHECPFRTWNTEWLAWIRGELSRRCRLWSRYGIHSELLSLRPGNRQKFRIIRRKGVRCWNIVDEYRAYLKRCAIKKCTANQKLDNVDCDYSNPC